MYTINAAFAMRQETVTGSLKVGKESDLIVVDTDIFNIEYDDIDKVQPLIWTFIYKRWEGKKFERNVFFDVKS